MMSRSSDVPVGSEEPLFNIGAVSRMTGISETTLRVWERRYDFPSSARTSGGHRLYSQDEVQRLQWIKQRIDSGMQISKAIRALRHLEREGVIPGVTSTGRVASGIDQNGDVTSQLRQRLFTTLGEHDSTRADQVLIEALALLPLEEVILDIIAPTLNHIGEAWSANQLDVATEHFATSLLRHHLLMWLRTGPPPYRVNPVLLACAPGELHEGSLLMLAVLLRRLRWPAVYLGQTVPLAELETFIEEVNAAAIVFVAMTEETARALAEWPRWMPDIARSQSPVVSFGGRIFTQQPALIETVPGLFLGDTLKQGVETLDLILREQNDMAR